MQNITPADMMLLQNSDYSIFAADALPFMIRHLDETALTDKERSYLQELKQWNFHEAADARAPTIFQAWWNSLQSEVWDDEFAHVQQPNVRPDAQTLLEMLLRDTAMRYADNLNTPRVETVSDAIRQ